MGVVVGGKNIINGSRNVVNNCSWAMCFKIRDIIIIFLGFSHETQVKQYFCLPFKKKRVQTCIQIITIKNVDNFNFLLLFF